MIELDPGQFSLAIPLFERASYGALGLGTLSGGHPGRVFVDRLPEPRAGLVCTRVGYYFLAGQPSPEQAQQVARLLQATLVPWQKDTFENPEFLLFYDPPGWQDPLLPALEAYQPVLIHKLRHTLPGNTHSPVTGWQAGIPDGMRVAALSAELVTAHAELRETAGLFYGSVGGFIQNGLGVAVLDGDEVACVCRTVFSAAGEAEIDILTAEPYRRRGLAFAAASACMEACLVHGIRPVWGCWPENTPSIHLARRLGFTEVESQPVCLWVVEDESPGNSA